jgi:hypothetical protein
MLAIVQTYLTIVEQHIDATHNLSDVVKKFAPTYNAMTQEQQLDVRDELVKLIARKKKVEYKIGEKGAVKGRLTFERGSAPMSMLNYYLPAKRVVETSSTKSKQVDKIASTAKRLKESMTKTELKRLIALLSA